LEIHLLTLSLYIPSTDKIFFDQNFIFVAKNHLYKHCGDVCNDVTLMPQILKVVWQHILGAVGNVINYFIENVTDFPAVKEF